MRIYVENGDALVTQMFMEERGFSVTPNPEDCDVICFTGGADVSPMLYDEKKLVWTQNSWERDEKCCNLYHDFYDEKKFVGICRGAQFLNVMNGGKMFQDVDGHTATHEAWDPSSGEVYVVTSTHHQMIIPAEDDETYELLLVADEAKEKKPLYPHLKKPPRWDTEALYYHISESLCYQPHPEYVEGEDECRRLFFDMIDHYLK